MRAVVPWVLLLTGCSSGVGPLEKPAPEQVSAQSLIAPPWQALVKAGAGAGQDVDLETLNGPQAAPAPAVAQVQPVATPPKPTPPGAIEIKSVSLTGVNGASAQGDKDLAAAMAKVLKGAGWPIVNKAAKDALSISAQVALDAAQGPNQTVRITWTVTSPKGRVLGTVGQNNAVPAHSLDGAWGPNADAAAEAAAEGIFRLIGQYR